MPHRDGMSVHHSLLPSILVIIICTIYTCIQNNCLQGQSTLYDPTTESPFTCMAQQTAETPQTCEHQLWMHRKSPLHLICKQHLTRVNG